MRVDAKNVQRRGNDVDATTFARSFGITAGKLNEP